MRRLKLQIPHFARNDKSKEMRVTTHFTFTFFGFLNGKNAMKSA